MKHLKDENSRLKQLMAELCLNKTMLQDVLRKKHRPSDVHPRKEIGGMHPGVAFVKGFVRSVLF
jgi:hypothetical protein